MRTTIVLMAATCLVMLLAGRGRAQEGRKTAMNKCGVQFVDCTTRGKTSCRIAGAKLSNECVARCRIAYDACLRQASEKLKSGEEVPAKER